MSAAVGADHKSVTSGCKLATLFGTYCDDGLNAVIGVQHTFAKSRGELLTFFDSYCDDGLNAVIGENFELGWLLFL